MEKKDREKKLYINTIVIFLSKFFTQFLSLLLLPFLTSQLSTSEYGSYDLICTYGLLITAFLTIQLESAIFRFLIDSRDNYTEMKQVVSNGLIAIVKNFTIISVIYFIIAYIFKIDYYGYIYLYAVASLVLSIFQQICRGIGDNLSYAWGSLFTGVTNLALCFLFIYGFNMGLEGMILSCVIAYCVGALYMFIKKNMRQYISIKYYDKKLSKKMINYALPLVPNNITSWILSISDKTMISYFISTSANGIYSIATKFPILISHVYSVFNLSWTESASLAVNDNDKSEFFSKEIDTIFKICISICVMTMSAMAIIFRIMINENYYEAYKYVPVLIFASIFEILSGLLGALYISLRKSKKIAITTLLAAIINIIINLIFMKKFGIIVACFSTLISYIFLSLYRYFDINRILKLKFFNKKYILAFVYLCVVTYFYYYDKIIISLISTIISAFVSLYLNKEFLTDIFNRFNNRRKRKKLVKE